MGATFCLPSTLRGFLPFFFFVSLCFFLCSCCWADSQQTATSSRIAGFSFTFLNTSATAPTSFPIPLGPITRHISLRWLSPLFLPFSLHKILASLWLFSKMLRHWKKCLNMSINIINNISPSSTYYRHSKFFKKSLISKSYIPLAKRYIFFWQCPCGDDVAPGPEASAFRSCDCQFSWNRWRGIASVSFYMTPLCAIWAPIPKLTYNIPATQSPGSRTGKERGAKGQKMGKENPSFFIAFSRLSNRKETVN